MTTRPVALVTGVSSGIGAATARKLVGDGYRVFGSVRSATTEVPQGVERVVFDVRDDASIRTAIDGVLRDAGSIDLLVNNAGVSVLGAIEETDVTQARELFDVNFFGVVRVTNAVLPSMRAKRAGRIVLVSSVVGFLPAPFMGFYAASKHALEGYGESLDHEVRTLGIRVVLVEPGFMKTKIDANAATASQTIDDYASSRARAAAAINASIANGDDPIDVANAIADVARTAHPKMRTTVGKGTGMLAVLRNLLPASMFDRSFRKQFQMDAS